MHNCINYPFQMNFILNSGEGDVVQSVNEMEVLQVV